MPFLVVSLPFLVLSGAPQILRPSAAHWIVKVQNRFSLSLPFLVASPSNAGNVFLFSVGLVGLQLERLKPSEREDPHHLRHRLGILRRARHVSPLPFPCCFTALPCFFTALFTAFPCCFTALPRCFTTFSCCSTAFSCSLPFLVVSLPFLVLSGAPQILRPSAAHWIVKVQKRFSLSLPFLVASQSNAGNVFPFSVGVRAVRQL